MRKTLQIALVVATVGSWIVLALMIVRQNSLLAHADPTRDTGLTFGYIFLTNIGIPALLVLTMIVAGVLAWMNRRRRIQSKQINTGSALRDDESDNKKPNKAEMATPRKPSD